jgi:hypothetical protein
VSGRRAAERALDPVKQLDHLDLVRENRKQRALAALSRGKVHFRGVLGETLKVGGGKPGKQRHRSHIVNRQHGLRAPR